MFVHYYHDMLGVWFYFSVLYVQFAKHHAATLVIYTAIVIAKDGDIEYTMYIYILYIFYMQSM